MVIEFIRADFYGHNLTGLVYAYHETPLKKCLIKELKRKKIYTRNAHDVHIRVIGLKEIKNILDTFRDHVHPHRITGTTTKPYV